MKAHDVHPISHVILHAILADIGDIQNCHLEYEHTYLDNLFVHNDIDYLLREFVIQGKAIESSLITSSELIVSPIFCLEEGTRLPRFLYLLLSTIFTDSGKPRYIRDATGRVVDSDGYTANFCIAQKNADAVFLLRQFFLAFAKAEDIEVPEEKIKSQLSEFSVRATQVREINSDAYGYVRIARRLLSDLLMPDGRLHPVLAQWEANPFGRHGPGAVSGKETGVDKWCFDKHPNLDPNLFSDAYGNTLFSKKRSPSYSRLELVPKDLRGKRLICIEPKEHQYAQQGLAICLTDIMHRSVMSNHHINLSRQDLSFHMAGFDRFSTIDLKDASDTISLPLLRLLLPKEVFALLTRYRTQSIRLPDGSFIRSRIGFTMGNALCFPVETLVFWALACSVYVRNDVHGLFLYSGLPSPGLPGYPEFPSASRIAKYPLRVFGDDIIVTRQHYAEVLSVIRGCGLVPNTEKCCSDTLVREACGSWYYASKDVVITKFHYAKTSNISSWISFESTISQQRDRGLLNLANALEEICNGIYPLPSHIMLIKNIGVDRIVANGKIVDISRLLRYNHFYQRMEYCRPVKGSVTQRPLPGRVGLTAYWTDQAIRSSYTDSRRVKYEWTPVL